MNDPLLTAALLGAARSSAPAAPDASLETSWREIQTRPAPEALLGALAITRSLRLAGTKTRESSATFESAPADESPQLSDTEIAALNGMLRGDFSEVMPEWLAGITPSGRIAPARLLPEILDAGKKHINWREGLSAIAGNRGRWIAKHHSAYDWLTGGNDDAWNTGSPAERLHALRKIRATAPDQAAKLISGTWNGETPEFREAIASLAAASPVAEDESWLETLATKERRQQTRDHAFAALMQLPDSGFAKRTIARATSLVRIERKILRQVIVVEPPSSFDANWKSDGISEKPPAGTGEKSWWLRQIIAAVPLSFWPGHLGMQPADLFSKTIDSDWKESLVLGWIDSANSAPPFAIAEHFIPFLTTLDPWPKTAPARRNLILGLLPSISATGLAPLIDHLAKSLPPLEFIELLANAEPVIFARPKTAALDVLRNLLAQKPSPLTQPFARQLALTIPREHIRAELEHLSRLPELTAAAEAFATTLEFRQSLFP